MYMSNICLPTMKGFAELPAVVLELVFSHLTVFELLEAAKVCTTWRALINHTRFWFKRLHHQWGIQIHPDLKSKLIGSQVNQSDTLSLLQDACLYREDYSIMYYHLTGLTYEDCEDGTADKFDWRCIENDESCEIEEEEFILFSALLIIYKPSKITIRLKSDPESIRNKGIFWLVLSYNSCEEVEIEDLYSFGNLFNSTYMIMEQFNDIKCRVIQMWTAVNTIEVLPTTIEDLRLSLLWHPTTHKTVDPGIAHLTQRFPKLRNLGIHLKLKMETEHLPHLPDLTNQLGLAGNDLYLSDLSENDHIQWAVNTAKTLQPPSGRYGYLCLLSCSLHIEQLCELVLQLAAAGVTIFSGVYISTSLGLLEHNKLRTVTLRTFNCCIRIYANDTCLKLNESIWTKTLRERTGFPI
ncbi:unnamed protein product [Meganyctiphanes norvegica]|uniref:F-box domain-containing protein n=1 Tax=Meganyctiphanes norvegica TaxID=48144 RepID=A0AAV2PLG2_MEGNR